MLQEYINADSWHRLAFLISDDSWIHKTCEMNRLHYTPVLSVHLRGFKRIAFLSVDIREIDLTRTETDRLDHPGCS